MSTRHEMDITCSEDLTSKDQREFVKQVINRSVPGIKHTFMDGGSLRQGVNIHRYRTKIKVTAPR